MFVTPQIQILPAGLATGLPMSSMGKNLAGYKKNRFFGQVQTCKRDILKSWISELLTCIEFCCKDRATVSTLWVIVRILPNLLEFCVIRTFSRSIFRFVFITLMQSNPKIDTDGIKQQVVHMMKWSCTFFFLFLESSLGAMHRQQQSCTEFAASRIWQVSAHHLTIRHRWRCRSVCKVR